MKSSEPPPTTLRDVATNVSRPRRNGPVHGAAMRPPTMPIANAPRKPRPPTWLRRACHDIGRLSSNAPNIDAASAANSSTIGITTNGFARIVPNWPPTSAMMTPRLAYVTPMPMTYEVASNSALPRLTSLPRAPKMPRVIGIIGYTHGVSDVWKPKPNDARYIHAQPRCWYSLNGSHAAAATPGMKRTASARATAGQTTERRMRCDYRPVLRAGHSPEVTAVVRSRGCARRVD